MPRQLRPIAQNTHYHVFNRGVEKRNIFIDDCDRQIFIQLLSRFSRDLKVDVFCYCLMTNHYHLFLKTNEANIDKFMKRLHLKYVSYFNSKYQRVGALFQGRYQSRLVEDDIYALSVCRYIHKNPIELGTEVNFKTYPWSSYKDYLTKTTRFNEWLNKDFLMGILNVDNKKALKLFEDFHAMGSDPGLTPLGWSL